MAKKSKEFQLEVPKKSIEKIFSRIRKFGEITNVRLIESGGFNTSYIVSRYDKEDVVLRVAPGKEVDTFALEKGLLRREHAVMPYASSSVKGVPGVLHADFSKKVIDRDYVVLEFLEGASGDSVITAGVCSNEEELIWRQLSEISDDSGSVLGSHFGFPYPGVSGETWGDAVISIIEVMVSDIQKYGLPAVLPREFLSVSKSHIDTLNEIQNPQLVHGDLWPKNTLIDNSKCDMEIVGTLDWERAFWGDQKAEWILCGNKFAGNVARKGYVFRCGLFSENFTDIPISVAEKYEPENKDQALRSKIYLGTYLTQRLLESQRFPRQELWVRDEYEKAINYLC